MLYSTTVQTLFLQISYVHPQFTSLLQYIDDGPKLGRMYLGNNYGRIINQLAAKYHKINTTIRKD